MTKQTKHAPNLFINKWVTCLLLQKAKGLSGILFLTQDTSNQNAQENNRDHKKTQVYWENFSFYHFNKYCNNIFRE